jgi:hypothetical protein
MAWGQCLSARPPEVSHTSDSRRVASRGNTANSAADPVWLKVGGCLQAGGKGVIHATLQPPDAETLKPEGPLP